MIKILDSKIKNFDVTLDKLLSQRKSKVQLNSISVTKITKDVKKNGDKAVLKYEMLLNRCSESIRLFPLNSRSFTSPYVATVYECQNRVYK